MKPQEPVAPYPYIEKEVSFTNSIDGTVLNGTLTLPDQNSKYPAAILITGSGAHDRDETIGEHKSFKVIADHLTKSGIAVLRFDDRHLKMPIKKAWEFTSMDFAGDVQAGFEFLQNQSEIDKSKIGLIGHSEGGMIAPIVASKVASKNKDIAFIVSLAGPVLSGKTIMLNQAKDFNKSEIEKQYTKQCIEIVFKEDNYKNRVKQMKKLLIDTFGWFHYLKNFQKRAYLKITASNWSRYFIMFDPVKYWEKITTPVLAINGELDVQVKPRENLNLLEQTLAKNNHSNFRIETIKSANHLFQISKTQDIHKFEDVFKEYFELEETFNEDVLIMISDWINENINKF